MGFRARFGLWLWLEPAQGRPAPSPRKDKKPAIASLGTSTNSYGCSAALKSSAPRAQPGKPYQSITRKCGRRPASAGKRGIGQPEPGANSSRPGVLFFTKFLLAVLLLIDTGRVAPI